MRAGADVVYQATFFDGTWRGHADFLLRRDHVAGEPDSAFGPWHYEVADTKLARHVKASAILQICSYVEQLDGRPGRAAGAPARGPRRPRTARRTTLRVDDYMAYYRRVKAELRGAPSASAARRAAARVPAGRHLPRARRALRRLPLEPDRAGRAAARTTTSAWSPVPRARQRRALKARGVATRRALAVLPLPMEPALEGVGARALERIRDQARIQVESEDAARGPAGSCCRSTAAPTARRCRIGACWASPSRGRATCSSTSRATRSRSTTASTTCSGSSSPDCPRPIRGGRRPDGDRVPRFHAIWSLDDEGQVTWAAEKAAFERTIDLIIDRLERDPAIHVYHYAAYERTALGRLAQRHGTREEEVDRLLRGRRARRPVQGRPPGRPGGRRELLDQAHRAAVRARARGRAKDAGSSIVAFETWLELGPEAPVEDAASDPRRDRGLQPRRRREQLAAARLARGPAAATCEAPRGRGAAEARGPTMAPRRPSSTERDREVAGISERLTADVPDDPVDRAQRPEAAARWLLAPAAGLAPPRGQVGLVALLRADGHDRRGADRRARAPRPASS